MLALKHRHESSLRLHPFDPSPNLWKIIQRKAAFVGNMCISEEGDVGDAVIADKKLILRKMMLP